jgi:hypothetical protein
MRKLFILTSLVFALVTGATATVVATTIHAQSMTAADMCAAASIVGDDKPRRFGPFLFRG